MINMIFTKTVIVTGIFAAGVFAIIEPFDVESRIPEMAQEILDRKLETAKDEYVYGNTDDSSSSSNSDRGDAGDTSSSQDAR